MGLVIGKNYLYGVSWSRGEGIEAALEAPEGGV
jgi:hypothetical protein